MLRRTATLGALLASVLVLSAPGVSAQETPDCSAFHKDVRATYTFKPSTLSESEKAAKSAAMDRIWESVKARPKELTPCLRRMLEAPDANGWFRLDGSNLLVDVDPSESSKRLQVRAYTEVDLQDVNPRVWVETLARRGTEGHDVSEAAVRWFGSPNATYFLPEHGAAEVNQAMGAVFLFGSMDEALATPALVKLASGPASPVRELAVVMLMNEATDESRAALERLDRKGLSPRLTAMLDRSAQSPEVFAPREAPRNTREEFLHAFRSIESGDWDPFMKLATAVPDGERDVVAVLQPEDLPLLRRVRRLAIARATPHAIEYYKSFTGILQTLTSTSKKPTIEPDAPGNRD